MSKFTTVLIPTVPAPICVLFEGPLKPPHIHAISKYEVPGTKKALFDMEFTFAIPEGEDRPTFVKDAKIATLMAYYMMLAQVPEFVEAILKYLVTHDPEWRANEEEDMKHKKGRARLHDHYMHSIIEKIGDVMGMDHRPCWKAGECLHEKEEK